MKAALGGGYLLNIVVIIVSIVMLLFVGVLAYSKAYRVKNQIVEIVEKFGYSDTSQEMINENLKTSGYNTTRQKKCTSGNLNTTAYNYCVYGPFSSNEGQYYKIVTYVHFDFPVIGTFVNIPVKGETKILNKKYDY